jgi:hypothetical protein
MGDILAPVTDADIPEHLTERLLREKEEVCC